MFEIAEDIKKASTLPKQFYLSDEIFERSKDAIFRNTWHLVHPDKNGIKQRQTPIDILPDFLDECALLINHPEDGLRLMSNVCTHRGNLLVTEANDRPMISCSYHGRCFGLNGQFRSMPHFDGVEDFPSESDHLRNYEKLKIGPILFGQLSDGLSNGVGEGLKKSIEEIKKRMPDFDFERLQYLPTYQKTYQLEAHWALYVDNYLEGFHVPFVHPSLGSSLDMDGYEYEVFEGHNLQLGVAKAGELSFELTEDSPDFGRKIYAYYWWIFPNIMLNCYPWGLSLNVVEPVGTAMTNIRYETYLFDVENEAAHAATAIGETEMEDAEVVLRVQRGLRSGVYDRGRYSPVHERCVHHFHRLLAGNII